MFYYWFGFIGGKTRASKAVRPRVGVRRKGTRTKTAERAWKLAEAWDKPVRVRASAATRVTSSDRVTAIKTEIRAAILRLV